MNIHLLTPALELTYACGQPQGTPKGAFARFLHELGIDGCTVVLEGAMQRAQGVLASPPGNWFVDGGKKG